MSDIENLLDLIAEKDVLKRYPIGKKTIRKLRKISGCHKLGRNYFYSADQIEQLIALTRIDPCPDTKNQTVNDFKSANTGSADNAVVRHGSCLNDPREKPLNR